LEIETVASNVLERNCYRVIQLWKVMVAANMAEFSLLLSPAAIAL